VVRGIAAIIHQNRTPGNGNSNVPSQEHGDARFRYPEIPLDALQWTTGPNQVCATAPEIAEAMCWTVDKAQRIIDVYLARRACSPRTRLRSLKTTGTGPAMTEQADSMTLLSKTNSKREITENEWP
jgi:hypothetical protein